MSQSREDQVGLAYGSPSLEQKSQGMVASVSLPISVTDEDDEAADSAYSSPPRLPTRDEVMNYSRPSTAAQAQAPIPAGIDSRRGSAATERRGSAATITATLPTVQPTDERAEFQQGFTAQHDGPFPTMSSMELRELAKREELRILQMQTPRVEHGQRAADQEVQEAADRLRAVNLAMSGPIAFYTARQHQQYLDELRLQKSTSSNGNGSSSSIQPPERSTSLQTGIAGRIRGWGPDGAVDLLDEEFAIDVHEDPVVPTEVDPVAREAMQLSHPRPPPVTAPIDARTSLDERQEEARLVAQLPPSLEQAVELRDDGRVLRSPKRETPADKYHVNASQMRNGRVPVVQPRLQTKVYGLTPDLRNRVERAVSVSPEEIDRTAAKKIKASIQTFTPNFSVELAARTFDARDRAVYMGRASLIRGIVRLPAGRGKHVVIRVSSDEGLVWPMKG